jgi:DNA-binding CsgD family transcriptional regulator
MKDSRTTVLLERDKELRELDLAVERALDGHGSLVLVEGAAGIGKTRVLDAGRACARARGMAVLSARASELDRQFPFGVVRQLFEPLVAGTDAGRRARLLHGAAGLVASLLGVQPSGPDEPTSDLDPAFARLHALYWMVANLAEESPAALVIDDVHWADASSLRFLEFLLPRLEELPVLVAAATRRPAPQEASRVIDVLATDALTVVLRPAPLSAEAVAALVAAALGASPDGGFRDACHHATGGSPFLINELLRELATEGIQPSAGSVPVVRQLAPPTVARAVLLRVARLGDEASALARAVAVLGDGAPLHTAAVLARLSDERAGELAAALSQADILAPVRPLAFAHPILRAAVYGDIDAGERDRAHRHAAELLAEAGAGADSVAVHLLATDPSGDPHVVETLRSAASSALSRGAASAAVAWLRRALEEPPPPAERGTVIFELGSAELRAGEPAAAVDHFDEAMRITSDAQSRASRWWEHSIALQALGRYDESFALRARAVEEVSSVDAELALSIEASLVASACVDLSRLGWARERVERHRGRVPAGSRAAWRLLAIQAWLDAFYGDAPAEAIGEAAERALAARERLGDGRELKPTPFFMAVDVLLLADRVEPARQALDRALDDARRRGSALGFASASGWRCFALARGGALAEAEADARRCAELSLPPGWFKVAPPMLGYVLDVLLDRGELETARQLLEQAGMATGEAGRDLTRYMVVRARGRLRAALGDVPGGRADLAEVAGSHARWNTHPARLPAALVAPELAGTDREQARRDADRMLREARAWGTPRAIGMALRFAALAADHRRGLDLLGEAAAVLATSPAPIEHARALADLGAALRRANRRAAAREPLRRALDIADACGAEPVAARARQELRAAGGRPRRPRVSGVDALTASERRIATMAAEGLSNPDIAQALFITKKTVEAHLGSAYRKLEIHSRTQLAAALGHRPRETG